MSTGADMLTDSQKITARAVVAHMLLAEPSTTSEIIAEVRRRAGGSAGDPYRNFVDRQLQALRKDGCATHSRQGRLTYWSYTAAGREQLERIVKVAA